jgi:ribosomal protein S18 acetylase RimI-like enzyme
MSHKERDAALQFRRATSTDFDAVYSIVLEAATWLHSRNIPQWNWLSTDKGKTVIRRRIENAETYLVFDPANQPLATFTLQWEDEQIWGPRGRDGTAGYVHGLAVTRCAAGKSLGVAMMEYAASKIAQNSRRLMRLDCDARNPSLCDYYRRAGFVDAGINDAIGFGTSSQIFVQLFERPIDGHRFA